MNKALFEMCRKRLVVLRVFLLWVSVWSMDKLLNLGEKDGIHKMKLRMKWYNPKSLGQVKDYVIIILVYSERATLLKHSGSFFLIALGNFCTVYDT